MTSTPTSAPDLLTLIDRCTASALDSGALLPIRTEQATVADGGLPFAVRWVSSLAHKDAARVEAVSRRDPAYNPFLPPDPELTVAALGDDHLAVLNKYPVIERHLLIVTRHFEAQTAPLSVADLGALARVMRAHDGLGFYNGGTEAGASQPHKHLQWVPSGAGLAAFLPAATAAAYGAVVRNPALPWDHAFIRLEAAWWRAPAALAEAFATACAAVGLDATADPMPPYNLLLTRDWLLVVPRSRDQWDGISVNALGFAGSLFVRRAEDIERLRADGPLRLLAGVARRTR